MLPLPVNEPERLKALRDLGIVDTPREACFDAICSTAAALFSVPVCLVTLVTSDRQWIKASCGTEAQGTPRDVAFCSHTILSDDVFAVEDATRDPRFQTNPLVTGPSGIRFYAGVPLSFEPGLRLGTLCLIDTKPRSFSSEQVAQLQALAEVVTALLRSHEAKNTRDRASAALLNTGTALRDSEARYHSLADALPQMVWVVSAKDRITTYRNTCFRAYYGENQGRHKRSSSRNHPDDIERMRQAWHEAVEGEHTFEIEGRLRRHDGLYRWHRIVMIPILHEGIITEWLGTALDIDHILSAQKALEETTDLLRLAQEAAEAGVWEWDLRSDVVRLSPMSARMHNLPYAPDQAEVEISVEEWKAQIVLDDQAIVWLIGEHALQHRSTFTSEFRIVQRDAEGAPRWIQSIGRFVFDESGEPIRCVGLEIDITARKGTEQRIAHLASHDILTGLPNRAVFYATLERRLIELQRDGGRAAVLYLDLDRFKAVNDTLGHLAGDKLLREVGQRLRMMARDTDTIARLGGDEFAIILNDLDETHDAGTIAQHIIDAIDQPIDLGGQTTTISVSIGIALVPDHGTDADVLHCRADLALYQAKAADRNTFRFYTDGMDAAIESRSRLEFDMRQAIQHGGFVLNYQPVIDLNTGRVTSFEALLRWPHETRGLVSPIEFIPIAEDTGLVVPLGAWVLRQACREAASWPKDVRVAVNVSAVQFQRPGLEQSVICALAGSGLDAWRLELEITESILVQDGEAVIACLHRLRAMGVRIALDDFGTGYSSLSYLRRFPFDKIKIDRAFIRDIADPDTAAIVRAVVTIGERLGTAITAEGVETEDQLALVSQVGCTEVQGFLFSKPLSSTAAMHLLEACKAKVAA
ncbi:EAL domain-containing protein [Methylobacterium sp. BTF04]|uniref:sensor domain-containing phosphodiesterase n=1 Tax=Methylobacterium sp. BTF04 TaxID=2708300 RepID=UPI0013D4166D|nr:EAL domain-containing protein [Methylobacterium sp. BTF04]NEU14864.1 EAL domain-containing protein [Methylobacterium sp. BTF04]